MTQASGLRYSALRMSFRAVFFDLGGVVMGSPLHAIAQYEREHGLPAGAINRVVVATAPDGAWSRLERGEMRLPEFFTAFEADCGAAGHTIDARRLMLGVANATVPHAGMLAAIRALRAAGIKVAAITNNWITEDEGTGALKPHFDAFIESAVTGVRKPDPRIFEIACDALGVAPADAVFLDDIGMNCKAGRQFGFTTIKVADPDVALAELAALVGLDLRAA